MVAGEADDRAVGRQPVECRVELLDRLALDLRVLRVTGRVGRLLVDEDERLAGIESLADVVDSAPEISDGVVTLRRVDRLQPERTPEPAQKGRVCRERTAHPMPPEKRRHRARPSEPLQRDHVEALALEPAHDLARPLLAGARRRLRLRDERLRAEHRVPRAEEGVRVRYALVGAAADPQHRLAAPDVRQREGQPVDLDAVAALDQPLRLLGVPLCIGPAGQPPAVVAPLRGPERRVREDVLRAHPLPPPERLEDRSAGELVGPVAEHGPVRHLARRRATRADRVEHPTGP